jgi:hypothetical protein
MQSATTFRHRARQSFSNNLTLPRASTSRQRSRKCSNSPDGQLTLDFIHIVFLLWNHSVTCATKRSLVRGRTHEGESTHLTRLRTEAEAR